jgi:hypothetical protein
MFKFFPQITLVFSSAFLLLLSCVGQESPFKPGDAKITLILRNSAGQKDTAAVTDTVEKNVAIGMVPYLSTYINSISISVAKSSSDTDTVLTFHPSVSWTDTQWIEITLHSLGRRTVSAVLSVRGEPNKIYTAEILIVGKPVGFLVDPMSDTISEDSSAVFFVKASVSGTSFTCQWLKDGTVISGATRDTLIISPVLPTNAGRYSCVIKDQWGDSITSKSALLTVVPIVNVNRAPIANAISDSTNRNSLKIITLSASDPDGDSLTAWQIVSGPFHGTASSTTSQIFTYTPTANFSGIDSMTFQVSDGSLPSNIATVRIKVVNVLVKPTISTGPSDQTVSKGPSGPSVSFSVKINSDVNPVPTFAWYRETPSGQVGTDSIFRIDTVKYSSAGKYRVLVTNTAGSDTSIWATLTVNDTTKPIITLKGAADTSILLNTGWTDPGATATDDKLGTITPVKADSVNVFTPGIYPVWYTATDGVNTSSVKRTVRVNGWVCVDSSLTAGYFQMRMTAANDLYISCISVDGNSVSLYKLVTNTWVKQGGTLSAPGGVGAMSFAVTPKGFPIVGYTTIAGADTTLWVNKLTNVIWEQRQAHTPGADFVDISAFSDSVIFGLVQGSIQRFRISPFTWDTSFALDGPFYLGRSTVPTNDVHVMAANSNNVFLGYKNIVQVIVKKLSGNSWVPAAADSVCYSPSFYSTIQMASANNRVFLADAKGLYLTEATVLELTGTTWTSLGTVYADDSYTVSLTASPQGVPFIAHSAAVTNPIFVKKFNGTDWVGYPEPGTGLVTNEGISYVNLQIGDNVGYVAGLGKNNKVYIFKFEKQ